MKNGDLKRFYGVTNPTSEDFARLNSDGKIDEDLLEGTSPEFESVFASDEIEFSDEDGDFGTNAKAKIKSAAGVDATGQDSGKVLTADGSGSTNWAYPSASNINSGSATSGQVLTANGSGGATWQSGDSGLHAYNMLFLSSNDFIGGGTLITNKDLNITITGDFTSKTYADFLTLLSDGGIARGNHFWVKNSFAGVTNANITNFYFVSTGYIGYEMVQVTSSGISISDAYPTSLQCATVRIYKSESIL